MESTTYRELYGAAQSRPPELPIEPEVVETICVERPLTSELIERVLDVARSRVVGANAKWVYLYYLLQGNHGYEKLTMRANARALNMPWETFRRARKELEEGQVIIPIVTGIRGSDRRLLVRDIREAAQNEPEGVAQNEPTVQLTQNEPAAVPTRSVHSKKVLISSSLDTNGTLDKSGSSDIEYRYVVGHEDLDEAFPTGPKAAPRGPKFRLKPPPGPNGERASPRARTNGHQQVPWATYAKLYEVCYGAKTSTAQHALGPTVKGRINAAIKGLVALDADLTRIGEFSTWWRTWAKGLPTPEVMVRHWANAMTQIEEEVKRATKQEETKLTNVSDDEYAKIVAALRERTLREHQGVAQ